MKTIVATSNLAGTGTNVKSQMDDIAMKEPIFQTKQEVPDTAMKEDFAKRDHFRDLLICSVDPPGCTDINDALHRRVLNMEFGSWRSYC